MPHFVVPHKSGVHRAACFALFRALLRQKNCSAIQGEQRILLVSQLRVAFHEKAKEQSPRAIVAALRHGYELLKILKEGATKRPNFPDHLTDFIAIPVPRGQPTESTKLPSSKQKSNMTMRLSRSGPRVWPFPGTISILDRPFLNLSGRRCVPHLVNGNGFPFLRFKKPQSTYLTRLIRDALHVRTKHSNQLEDCSVKVELGQNEDIWDENLKLTCGVKFDTGHSWAREAKKEYDRTANKQQEIRRRRADMGQKMYEITQKEQALADMEKAKRRSEKHRERYSRRLAQKSSSLPRAEIPQRNSATTEAT